MLTKSMPAAMVPDMDIPQWLSGMYQEGRELKRWTSVEEMSREYGFKAVTFYRWMTGSRKPDPFSCLRLARAFGTPVQDVLSMAGHSSEMSALFT